MSLDDLEKRKDTEFQNHGRRNSDLVLEEAMLQLKPELDKYNKVIRLYGQPPSPVLQAIDPSLPPGSKNESNNKILETRHKLNIENIENKLLTFFKIIFPFIILYRFSSYFFSKLGIDWPLIDYELANLIFLLLGRSIFYVFMITFFIRLYISLKVFSSSVTPDILLKLVNVQFTEFWKLYFWVIFVVAPESRLKLIPDDVDIIEDIPKFNRILNNIQNLFMFISLALHLIILIGVALIGLRKVRLAMRSRTV